MTSTLVANTVIANKGDGRCMFNLSNGNAMCVVIDGTNIKVYETSAADRKTGWTLRATQSVTAQLSAGTIGGVTADLFPDNSLGIAVAGADATNQKVIYFKMTYAGYALSAIDTPFSVATASNTLQYTSCPVDINITDNSAVVMAIVWTNGGVSQSLRLLCRHTGGTFGAATDLVLRNVGDSVGDQRVTIASLGITGSTRRVVVGTRSPYLTTGVGTNTGTQLFTTTVVENTGVWTAPTSRATYLAVGSNLTVNADSSAIKLFKTSGSVDMYHFGMVEGYTQSKIKNYAAYTRGTWDGTTWTQHVAPVLTMFQNPSSPLGDVMGRAPQANFSITCGLAGMAFAFVGTLVAGGSYTRAGIMQLLWSSEAGTTTNLAWHTGQWLDGAFDCLALFGGGGRNPSNKHDTLMVKSDNKPYHTMAYALPLPLTSYPDNGAVVTSATPTLLASGQYLDAYWAPAEWTADWEISQDSGFASGNRDYNFTDIIGLQNMDGSLNSAHTFDEWTATGYLPLGAGAWYLRVRLRDSYGNVSAWTTNTRLFTIGHPPTATPLSPLNNVRAEYGAGTKTFSWAFTDPSPTDSQTAYQVRVKTGDSAGTIIADTGKVVSSLKSVSVAIPSGNKNQTLYWEVKLWDTDDAAGIYSTGNTFFQMIDPATAAITAPTPAQVLSAGTMTLSSTVSASGSRVVKEYAYRIMQAGVVIWTSSRTLGTWSNGQTLTYVIPAGVLANNSAYTVQVMVIDDAGVQSTSAAVNFTTSWTPALSATVFSASAAAYNTEGSGYVQVSWTDANRESGFVSWNIYRRTDLIDPNTQAVLATGTYELVYRDFRAVAGTYTWNDYLAPSGQKVNYLIKQLAERTGFYVESENVTPATVFPITDGYWLIDIQSGEIISSIKLSFTTVDSFADEQEESEYTVIGRGRHVDKGDYLGPKGSVTVQIRNNSTMSARQKRLAILDFQKRSVPLYLRNPFGDVWKVNVSSMQVGRLAGTGISEFCDVQIPYSQVG